MDVVLHVGAHRTGTTTLQTVVRNHSARLARSGIVVWGPGETRDGRFAPLLGAPGAFPRCDATRLAQIELARLRGIGTRTVIMSEENMLGTMRICIRAAALYPDAGARLAPFGALAQHGVRRIGLAIRRPDIWWASVFAFQIRAGTVAPTPAMIRRVANSRRGWRAVIEDVAAAVPQAELTVWDFDALVGKPAAQLSALAGCPVHLPDAARDAHCNASASAADLHRLLVASGAARSARLIPPAPDRWMPFNARHRRAMMALHAADLAWLRAGADGLARFVDGDGGARPLARPGAQRRPGDDEHQRGLDAAG